MEKIESIEIEQGEKEVKILIEERKKKGRKASKRKLKNLINP